MRSKILKLKHKLRQKRKLRIKSGICGNEQCPRISIFRSNKYLYAQAIDDVKGPTIECVDGRVLKIGNNKEDAQKIAAEFAKKLSKKGITKAVFDRNGYLYHGVVASFAESLRNNGITL